MTGILSARIGSLIPSVLVVNYCACSIASLPNDLASNFDMASDGVIADASLGIPCQYCCSAPKNDGSVMDAALLPNPDGGFALTDDPAIMFPSSLFVDDIAINSTTGLIYVVASAGSIGLLEVVDLNGGCINATLPFAGSYPVS